MDSLPPKGRKAKPARSRSTPRPFNRRALVAADAPASSWPRWTDLPFDVVASALARSEGGAR